VSDNPLPPSPDNPNPALPEPARVAPARGPVRCEFCECPLAPSGEFTKLSPRAKELRDLEQTLTDERAKSAALETDNSTLRRERDEARSAAQTTGRVARW